LKKLAQALLLVGSTRRIRVTKELHRALLVVRTRIDKTAQDMADDTAKGCFQKLIYLFTISLLFIIFFTISR
jgi:hypothetical protein